MKLYLDDERPTPAGWTRCYWPDEVIEFLKTDFVTEISLDHDLGDDPKGAGYDVLTWIEEAVVNELFFSSQNSNTFSEPLRLKSI